MCTLEEIARLSGVSRSTVSRVVNKDSRVHTETRQRIHFQPNPAARRLADGRTHILCLVIPRSVSTIFSDPFFPILIQAVSSACNASDFPMDHLEGYKASLRKACLPYDPNLVVESDFTEEGGFLAMQRVLPYRPEAVFAASDRMAAGALRAARAAGLRVPEDISLAGFNDLPFAAHSAPPLTTVRQRTHRIGALAVETLIEHPEIEARQVLLSTELVIRQSCCAAPAKGAGEPS